MYTLDGMRKSGDPNTSCGNTIINAIVHLYCFHKFYCKQNKWDMMNPKCSPSLMGINLLLLGDDNLGYLPEEFGEYVASG